MKKSPKINRKLPPQNIRRKPEITRMSENVNNNRFKKTHASLGFTIYTLRYMHETITKIHKLHFNRP